MLSNPQTSYELNQAFERKIKNPALTDQQKLNECYNFIRSQPEINTSNAEHISNAYKLSGDLFYKNNEYEKAEKQLEWVAEHSQIKELAIVAKIRLARIWFVHKEYNVFTKDVKIGEMVAQNALFFYDSDQFRIKNVGNVSVLNRKVVFEAVCNVFNNKAEA